MIGQKILNEKLNNVTLNTLPTPLILIGDKGCGKHLFTSMIGEKLNINIIDITDNLNLEFISQIYVEVNPYIYLINMDNVTLREQNIILKLLEEPPIRSFIILVSTNIHNIINTVQNRCQKWYFENYTEDDLKQFKNNDNNIGINLDLTTTPGQVIELNNIDIQPIEELANKIIDKISGAAIFNILTIPDKIAFKNEKDKINLDIFKKYLLYCVKTRISTSWEEKYLKYYNIIKEYINNSYTPKVDQKLLLDNLLINLYEVK